MSTQHKLLKNPRSGEIAQAFEKLVDLMYTLRSDSGCPWDRAQTLKNLRQYLLEESYEVLHALDHDDQNALNEELGDLLFQIIFLAQVMQERGAFTLAEIIRHLTDKMIRRHPHVFGDEEAHSAEQALDNWETMKSKEKAQSEPDARSILKGIPPSLPALLQAHLISSKVTRVGFDWETEDDVWKKMEEEIEEFRNAPDEAAREEEMGDMLFTLVNIARKHKINSEDALRSSNHKFRERFMELEKQVYSRNKELEKLTPQEMNEIWEASKSVIRNKKAK